MPDSLPSHRLHKSNGTQKRHGGSKKRLSKDPEDNDVYEGELNKDGKREGRGTCRFASGESYEGEWRHGKMDGRGCFKMLDGDMYGGTWKNGLKDGPGTYYYASGNADVVNYSGGEEVDEGVRFLADRSAAWKLLKGDLVGEISLEEAREIVDRIGEMCPPQLKEGSPSLRMTGGALTLEPLSLS
ncbi:morn repeat [Chrysochromulina tobinii]|uniref:Morn repeat n=1 Tax=Chrysochromulina tobinii TaxID=1460289 RepID=A0A0M0JLM6_9EUKA|nr:morn repeat [Chrysochromulina tobinii]|eukprot:KOO27242.1 morn repeat [Chrysochromulina sp. CCMP291]